jgi:hydroxymethylglutaryl-CoA lyase
VCTEDLVHLCHEIGIDTGLDLRALMHLSRELPEIIGHDVAGQVARAGRSRDLHPIPEVLRPS